MGKIENIFKVEFKEEDIQDMKPLDGILALLYYLFYMVLLYCFGLIMFDTDLFIRWAKYFANMDMYKFIFYIPITVLSILPAILIIFFRKQSVSSLGIRKTKVMKSIFLGIIFSLPFLISNNINGIINNYNFRNIESLTWNFLYYLICIGLVEEVIFRGFIQTRIRGIIKNKWVSIFVVGFMFSILHIPFQMLQANLSLIEFIQHDMPHLINLVIIHVYFVYIYTRDNNLIAPIITHTIINFSNHLFM